MSQIFLKQFVKDVYKKKKKNKKKKKKKINFFI